MYVNDNPPSKSFLGKYSLEEVMINNNFVKISLKNGGLKTFSKRLGGHLENL